MSIADQMREKLEKRFAPEAMELRDDSERHRGHGGWREGGETHFHLRLVSAAFDGMNRLARQRAVNAALTAELSGPVHALSMELRAPSEAG